MKDFEKQRREGTGDKAEDADDEVRRARERALAEARANATRGPRPKPFPIGCALFCALLVCGGATFAVGLLAAFCAHRWGIS